MSGTAAPGRPSAEELRCVGCAEPFGSAVQFCPFCGAAQRLAVVQALRPIPVSVPPAPPPPAAPAVAAADVVPAAVAMPVQPVGGPKPVRPVARRGSRWVAWLAAACVLALGAEIVWLRQPAPVARLVVRVHGPGGALVPGGQVVVNNRDVGAPGQALAVPPGPATVTYVQPGWRAEPRSVTLAANALLTIDMAARELPGHVTLTTTPPGASVTAGGRSYGRSPVSVDLAPGPYEFSVALSGYAGKIVSVTVVHGDAAAINVDLTPAPVRRMDAPFDRGVLSRSTPLLSAPAANAEVLAVMPPGAEVQVQARVVADTPWLQVRAAGRTGFVSPDSVEAWESWAQRNTVSGTIDTVTPDLRVGIAGALYPLAGVQAPPRGAAELGRMSAVLLTSLRGAPVRCTPRNPGSFVCRTADGGDVAERYVFNGCAVASDGAPPHYAELQRTAQEQQRGAWAP